MIWLTPALYPDAPVWHSIADSEMPPVTPRILELNFGDWEMQYFNKIKDPNLQCWYDDYMNVKATNGESFADQYRRVAAFLDEIKQKEAENIVVFAHGGVLICAQIYAKLIHQEEAFQAVPAYGGVFLYQECP